MSRYEDALQDCLDAVRAGLDPQAAIAAHPEHAERLRQDLTLSASIRSLATQLPAPRQGAASLLQAQLADERRARAAGTETARPRFGFGRWPAWLRAGGLATAAALTAVVVLMALGVGPALPGLSGSAEAASLEGVVVDNANGVLTLQTDSGLQSVSLADGASITDTTGASLDLSRIETGQVLQVKGKRVGQAVVARLVSLQASGELGTWCSNHVDRCRELAQSFQQRASQCQDSQPACQAVKARLQDLRGHLADLTRLDDLKQRCDSGGKAACQEIATFCGQHVDLCKAIAGYLRSHKLSTPAK